MIGTAASEWWAHALGFGLLVTVVCGAVLIAVEFLAPYAFLDDYPEDIRRRAPAPTAAQRRAGVIGGIVFVIALICGIGGVVWSWGRLRPEAGFLELALMALVVGALFVLFDVLIIDWLIICTWRPGRLVYPGTEDCEGWGDYGFHVREQLRPRALAVLVLSSAVIGLVVWWLT
ncbi:hypothetical protein J4H92_08520 [Leucobacter weissii]|uniref:Uncharacterized protein n=1 Tax=Leucobacter weissii TaxID=1983706 RepID=A0A939SC12_9MICO|nr:hypothetical protein [Leucobacter weissii]MBO1901990.1 hypothetical protein [Leucobacter weissii]